MTATTAVARHDTLTVLDPTAGTASTSSRPTGLPLPAIEGTRVAFLDNGKSNSDEFLRRLATRLEALGAVPVRTLRKPGVGSLASGDQLDELLADVDVVVTGVGDCAGCCSCSVQDAVRVERRGTPAVLVCTHELVTTGRISARAAGAPDFPFAVVQHPVASCTSEELDGRVEVALEQLLARVGAP